MKKPALIIPAIALMLASATIAHARPDTRSLTCAEVQALVARQGGAVLATGPATYDRYVSASGRGCKVGQVRERVSVPSRDGGCPVYRCAEFDLSPG